MSSYAEHFLNHFDYQLFFLMKKLKDTEHKTREHNKNIQYFFCTK